MKSIFTLIIISFSFVASGQQAFLTQELINALQEKSDGHHPVLVRLEQQVDVPNLYAALKSQKATSSQRAVAVVTALKNKAMETQPEVIEFIHSFGSEHYNNIKGAWITNLLVLDASPELIFELANHPAVDGIDLDPARFSLIEPEKSSGTSDKSLNGHEPGHDAINAPFMWQMGYTGLGTTAYSIDTGIWDDHPALKNRFKPNYFPLAQSWFAYDSEIPKDKSSSHGTHTMGTVLGLEEETNDTIGIAFNAWFIASDPVVSAIVDVKPLSDFIFAFEFALDPDNDPNTTDDMPDVINNSWGFWPDLGEPMCPDFMMPVFDAVEAAGIANVFSAGNEGPEPFTMSSPHNINTGLFNTFTVGALNGNIDSYPIANFSSRGPSLCEGVTEGSLYIKPEVSAPGVNVRSAVQGGYDYFDGTSMAAPHVCGAVLLLKEAFPDLGGEEILEALYYSATDLGDPGEDNTYGNGLINLESAFNYLSLQTDPTPPLSKEFEIKIAEINYPSSPTHCEETFSPIVTIKNDGTEPISSLTFTYSVNGTVSQTMEWSGNLNSGEEELVELNPITYNEPGKCEFHVSVQRNDEGPEWDPYNNNAVQRYELIFETDFPFTENFEEGINREKWLILNPNHDMTWDTVAIDGLIGNQHAGWMNLFRYDPRASQTDELITAKIEIPEGEPSFLHFDYAYNKRANINAIMDTLQVLVYTTCPDGNNGDIIWIKGGEDLSTVDTVKIDFFPEYENHWEAEQISLEEWAGEEIYVSFKSINRKGNNLFLDNILISNTETSGVSEISQPEFSIFPNPSSKEITITSTVGFIKSNSIQLVDITGKVVQNISVPGSGNQINLDVESLKSGIYVIRIHGTDFSTSLRFMKL